MGVCYHKPRTWQININYRNVERNKLIAASWRIESLTCLLPNAFTYFIHFSKYYQGYYQLDFVAPIPTLLTWLNVIKDITG